MFIFIFCVSELINRNPYSFAIEVTAPCFTIRRCISKQIKISPVPMWTQVKCRFIHIYLTAAYAKTTLLIRDSRFSESEENSWQHSTCTMKFVFVMVLVILAMAIAQGASGACSETQPCLTVRCASPTNVTCPNGVIVPNAGICGCCAGCLIKIPKHKNCSELMESSNTRPTSACEEGTKCRKSCHGTWTCEE